MPLCSKLSELGGESERPGVASATSRRDDLVLSVSWLAGGRSREKVERAPATNFNNRPNLNLLSCTQVRRAIWLIARLLEQQQGAYCLRLASTEAHCSYWLRAFRSVEASPGPPGAPSQHQLRTRCSGHRCHRLSEGHLTVQTRSGVPATAPRKVQQITGQAPVWQSSRIRQSE